MIPLFNSQPVATAGRGSQLQTPPKDTENTDNGAVGRGFDEFLGSRGGPAVVDAMAVAAQDTLAESGKQLQPGGRSLPESAVPELDISSIASLGIVAPVPGNIPAVEQWSDPELGLSGLLAKVIASPVDGDGILREAEPQVATDLDATEQNRLLAWLATGQASASAVGSAPAADSALVHGLTPELAAPVVGLPPDGQLPGSPAVKLTPVAERLTATEAGRAQLSGDIANVTGRPPGSVDARFDSELLAASAVAKAEVAHGDLETAPLKAPAADQLRPVIIGAPLPASETSQAASVKMPVSPSIATPLGDPNWNSEFVGRMSVLVKNEIHEASIQLSPPELGPLKVNISMDGDQVKVVFNVQSGAAREAVEQAMPRLREMLEQSGLDLAHSDVNDHSQPQQRDSTVASDQAISSQPGMEDESPDEMIHTTIAASDSSVDYYV